MNNTKERGYGIDEELKHSNIPGITASVLFDPLLALLGVPTLELKVALVRGGPGALALQHDEEDGADDGDEVEG